MFALLHGGKQVGYFFILETVQVGKIFRRQTVEIGKRAEIFLFVQEGRGHFGKTFDVHGVLTCKVYEFIDDSRLAVRIGTEEMRAPFLHPAAAGGAHGRLFHGTAVLGVPRRAENLGNDFVGTADEYAGIDLHVFAENIAVIVERGAAHGYARQIDGFQNGRRGQFSRPSDLPHDVAQNGGRFFRFEFIRHRPAGEFIGISQLGAFRNVVEFDDRAVGQNVDVPPLHLDFVDGGKYLFRALADAQIIEYFESLFP